ncbi:MAG: DUF2199 domain-containing protein [Oryzihumus sp.]
MCGHETNDHDRHVRFRLPEPVLRAPDRDSTAGTWTTNPDPAAAVMIVVPNVGAFLRALLPVHLAEGHTLTYGIWVGVHPEDLKRAFTVWWEPEYKDLQLAGHIANIVEPWGLLGQPVNLSVRDPDQTPYCTSSASVELHEVLTREWEHGPVLAALP